jgi:hypothetical protein
LKDLFDSELMLAEMLAAKQLAKDAASVDALSATTMVDGLRADYAALIERKEGASLSYTRKGRKSAEKLLTVDSGCYDAYLALGVENDLLGIKPAPMRWILRVGGAHTNRDEGLQQGKVIFSSRSRNCCSPWRICEGTTTEMRSSS